MEEEKNKRQMTSRHHGRPVVGTTTHGKRETCNSSFSLGFVAVVARVSS